jgi:cytochrome c oxidase cbb3-type subunit 3
MLRVSTLLGLLLATLILSAACERAATNEAQSATPVAPAPADESVQLAGKEAYDLVCAGCHEEGIDGAPRTGDREAWAGRSWLWEAVLFEHAKDGYMEMPAKGGEESLDDATVEMAAEYMLLRTHPGVIRD